MNNKRLRMLNDELGLNDYAETPNSQAIAEKVNNSINADPAERRLFMRRRFINSALVTALILSIASLTVIAATSGWHHKLMEYFNNPSAEQMKLMNGAFDAPMISKADKDITVNVIQTLADNHGIYVLYEVEMNENIQLNESLSWEKQKLKIQYRNGDKKIGNGGYAYSKVISKEDNKYTMIYIRTGIGEIVNQKLIFELEGLKKINLIPDEKTSESHKISDCKFTFEWDFEYVNSGITQEVNKKINSGKSEISNIDISPISLWITITGEQIDNINDIKIQFNSGHEILITNKDYAIQYTPLRDGINTISFEFNEIININDVKSIIVDDQIIMGCKFHKKH
ncbi:MAG: hypothetical protein J6D26_09115 [Clostridia bacterium]|nr:hypothetical protein [Clostridia bacterium]